MRIVCAWCGRTIGHKGGDGISHGICPACYAKEMKKLSQPAYKQKGPSVSVRVKPLPAAQLISGGGNTAPCNPREDAAIGDDIDRYRLSHRRSKEAE